MFVGLLKGKGCYNAVNQMLLSITRITSQLTLGLEVLVGKRHHDVTAVTMFEGCPKEYTTVFLFSYRFKTVFLDLKLFSWI